MRTPFLAIPALGLALLFAGCGGVDKNAYVANVGKVQEKTQFEATALSEEMQKAKTPMQIAAKISELGASVQRNAAALGKIEAPDEVASEHKQYVAVMTDFGASLKQLSGRVERAKPADVDGILSKASSLTKNLSTKEQQLIVRINAKLRE